MDTETKTYKLSDLYPDVAAKAAQRLHIKKEEIPLVRKYFVADKDSVKVDAQERSVVARISCVNVDRDGESLLPSGVQLDNYKKNPIVCWGHSYVSPEQIIGKNLWIKADEQGLIAKTAFANNEFADQVYRAYTEDVGGTGPLLRGWSVGFIPIEYETPTKQAGDGPRRIYTKWELLEYSAVPIPCSPESLTLAYAKGILTSEALKKDMDPETPTPSLIPTTIDANAIEALKAEIVHKPETTDNYHRIPVSEGHADHTIRTITVSEKDGIKALYCVDDKEIITYLFDVNKWTMAEAEKWVEDHKKSLAEIMAESWMSDYPEGQDMDYHEVPFNVGERSGLFDMFKEYGGKAYRVHFKDQDTAPPVDGYAYLHNAINEIKTELEQALAEIQALRESQKDPEPPLSVEPAPAVDPAPPLPLTDDIELEDEITDEDIDIDAIPVSIAPADEVNLDDLLKSGEFRHMVDEAIEVGLAKLRGKVI
jgi:hypothetical protein